MLVIADTSPLRYLTIIGEIRLLPMIFGQVFAPTAVLEELTASSSPDDVRSLLESRPDWLKFQCPEPNSVDAVNFNLDRGERAALALALQLKADLVLIDDAAGRKEAKRLGIRTTGIVGVLVLAAERELIDARHVIPRLRKSGFYIDQKVLNLAFGKWL
jgi:predicted nucleic acid-binding protein